MFAQGEHVLVPVTRTAKPGKGHPERRVVPAPAEPRRVVHDAQASQRFDEVEFEPVKVAKILVTVQQCLQLRRLLRGVARQKHPQVLDGRTGACVVQVDDVDPVAGNQHVARVEIGMNPEHPQRLDTGEAGFHLVQDLAGNTRIGCREFPRYQAAVEQVVGRLPAIGIDIDGRPGSEPVHNADIVNACYQPADLPQQVEVVEVRSPATFAGIQGEAEVAMVMQGLAGQDEWSDYGNFEVCQFAGKCVLLENRGIAPAQRAVEFCDDRVVVLDAEAIDPVFVAVECEEATVAAKAETFDRIYHLRRLQVGEGFRGGSLIGHGRYCSVAVVWIRPSLQVPGIRGNMRRKSRAVSESIMRFMRQYFVVLFVAGTLAGCSADGVDAEQYEADLDAWREARLANLKGPGGYLNLAGLYWLEPGSVTMGSAEDSDIRLPAKAAAQVGQLQVSDAGVLFSAAPGADVRYEEIPVRTLLISDDTTENPVTLTHDSLAWSVIRRENRFALRLRDYEHPAIAAFPPIEYFPIDLELRVPATLKLFDEPKILSVDTVIEGLGWQPESPGIVEFEIGGKRLQLEAYAAGEELFFVFGDTTSGRETYPAGRFLYARRPDDGGTTVLDFNRAYNPPCAFNDFATCPVASPQNRLSVAVRAGEKYDPRLHVVPDEST